jgi:hypothetical protein
MALTSHAAFTSISISLVVSTTKMGTITGTISSESSGIAISASKNFSGTHAVRGGGVCGGGRTLAVSVATAVKDEARKALNAVPS